MLRVKARGQLDLATVVGHAALVSAGEFVSASGARVNDRTHRAGRYKNPPLPTGKPATTSTPGIQRCGTC